MGISFKSLIVLLIIGIQLQSTHHVFSQGTYNEYAHRFRNYDFSKRVVPRIPPKEEQIKVIIDADAKNEIDDQWALALALLSPERFDIKGIVGTTFAWGGPASVEMSVKEIDTMLHLTGLTGKIPVYPGSQPLQYKYTPTESPGVDFIIDQGHESLKRRSVVDYRIGCGYQYCFSLSQRTGNCRSYCGILAFAYSLARKMLEFQCVWRPPCGKMLFDAPMSFVLFDTGTYLYCPMEESEQRVMPHGELGQYLHNIRIGNDWYMSDTKGFFDLGDIAAMFDPSVANFEVVDCPEVDHDLSYRFKNSRGKILRIYHVDRDKTFQLLYDKLAAFNRRGSHVKSQNY